MIEAPGGSDGKSVADVLSDGLPHPVQSDIIRWDDGVTSFWISEVAEHPRVPEDHSNAQAYRVDLEPLAGKTRIRSHGASIIGNVAALGADIEVQLVMLENGKAYANNRTVAENNLRAMQETMGVATAERRRSTVSQMLSRLSLRKRISV